MVGKELIKRLDDKLDVDEALRVNMPSVISQNQAMQPGTGDLNDPQQQGGKRSKQRAYSAGDRHRLTLKWTVSSGSDYEFHLQSHTRGGWNDIQPWQKTQETLNGLAAGMTFI